MSRRGNEGLGFKDLHFFNLALLAKQGWRINMQETDSLIHKVFMAKYFPPRVFLNVGLDKRPSFAYRCIWEAKNLLSQDCIERTGDGKTTKLWMDPWIPITNH